MAGTGRDLRDVGLVSIATLCFVGGQAFTGGNDAARLYATEYFFGEQANTALGTGAATIPMFTGAGVGLSAGGVAAATIPFFTASAAGDVGVSGAGAGVIPSFTGFADTYFTPWHDRPDVPDRSAVWTDRPL